MIETLLRGALSFIPGAGPFLAMIPNGGFKVIAIVLTLGAGVIYVDRKATYRERAKCEAAAAIAAKKAADVDIAALREQAEAATATAKALEEDRNKADERARQLAAELEKRDKAGRCPISDDDARRLRGPTGGGSRR